MSVRLRDAGARHQLQHEGQSDRERDRSARVCFLLISLFIIFCFGFNVVFVDLCPSLVCHGSMLVPAI